MESWERERLERVLRSAKTTPSKDVLETAARLVGLSELPFADLEPARHYLVSHVEHRMAQE